MKIILIVLLFLTAIAMIYLGMKGNMLPPTLTGIGFIVIGVLFFLRSGK